MWKLLSTTAVVLVLAGPTWAQTATDEAMPETYPLMGQAEPGSWTADTLVGQPVRTSAGETIGTVENVVFTPDDRIRAVVIDTGQYLGTEARPVMVDWRALSVSPDDTVILIDLTREQLTAAPETETAGMWRAEKVGEVGEAGVSELEEVQPGVITGIDVEDDDPAAGRGGSDSGPAGAAAGAETAD